MTEKRRRYVWKVKMLSKIKIYQSTMKQMLSRKNDENIEGII
jgi:hypothetical protein